MTPRAQASMNVTAKALRVGDPAATTADLQLRCPSTDVFYRCLLPVARPLGEENGMKGYVARKGERYYAVIYEGLDPLTGRECRRWYPAGTCEQEARRLAARPAESRRSDRPE